MEMVSDSRDGRFNRAIPPVPLSSFETVQALTGKRRRSAVTNALSADTETISSGE